MSDHATKGSTISRRQLIADGCAAIGDWPPWTASGSAAGHSADRATRSSRLATTDQGLLHRLQLGQGGRSPPGTYAQADPAEHVRWYQDLGANTIQTFCVSYNGYAWYPSEVAPVTPGLKHPNFLGEMVELGHKAGMKVMGYFTLGANPYWEKLHPDLVHGDDSDYIKIPMTLEYLDYFCRCVEDAIVKTGVDGFMIDWVRPTQHKNWLACEKEMYRQLLGEKFPESGPPSAEAVLEFDRRATRPSLAAHPLDRSARPARRSSGRTTRSSRTNTRSGPAIGCSRKWTGCSTRPRNSNTSNGCGSRSGRTR